MDGCRESPPSKFLGPFGAVDCACWQLLGLRTCGEFLTGGCRVRNPQRVAYSWVLLIYTVAYRWGRGFISPQFLFGRYIFFICLWGAVAPWVNCLVSIRAFHMLSNLSTVPSFCLCPQLPTSVIDHGNPKPKVALAGGPVRSCRQFFLEIHCLNIPDSTFAPFFPGPYFFPFVCSVSQSGQLKNTKWLDLSFFVLLFFFCNVSFTWFLLISNCYILPKNTWFRSNNLDKNSNVSINLLFLSPPSIIPYFPLPLLYISPILLAFFMIFDGLC